MKIERRMRRAVVTVQKDETVDRAQTLMAQQGIRHLPVLDGQRLVGILSDRDIHGLLVRQRAGAGRAECGRAYFLVPGVRVEEVMTPKPLTVAPDTDLEEATRLLITRKIGCLPVVDRGRVVGIITETDILGVVTEIMGLLEASSRIDIALGRDPRALERTSEIIRRHRGKIISVGVTPGRGGLPRVHHFRLKCCNTGQIAASLRRAGFRVLEQRGEPGAAPAGLLVRGRRDAGPAHALVVPRQRLDADGAARRLLPALGLPLQLWQLRARLADNHVAGAVTYLALLVASFGFFALAAADETPWMLIHTMSIFAFLGAANLFGTRLRISPGRQRGPGAPRRRCSSPRSCGVPQYASSRACRCLSGGPRDARCRLGRQRAGKRLQEEVSVGEEAQTGPRGGPATRRTSPGAARARAAAPSGAASGAARASRARSAPPRTRAGRRRGTSASAAGPARGASCAPS